MGLPYFIPCIQMQKLPLLYLQLSTCYFYIIGIVSQRSLCIWLQGSSKKILRHFKILFTGAGMCVCVWMAFILIEMSRNYVNLQ